MIYLIGGSVRTGKSSLAQKILSEKHFSILSTDVLIEILAGFVKPQSDTDKRPYFIKKAENFFPYLEKIIMVNHKMGVKDYVYEGDIIIPEFVATLPKDLQVTACFLGFSDINLKDLQNNIGNHQWLDELTDEKLNQLPKRIVDTSKLIEEGCRKYGFKYFDLAIDYEKVHEQAYKYLVGD